MFGIKTLISSIYNGQRQSFIYIWVSKVERLVYVGQTNEKYGTFGRSYSHIQSNGTLRCRCKERIGLELEQINDLNLFSYPLPTEPEFISVESSYRLAVEYLVQAKLYEKRKELSPSFQIISNISTNGRTSNNKVMKLADSIVENFLSNYGSI
jgi:hypothetical protein